MIKGVLLPIAVESFGTTGEMGLSCGILGGVGHDTKDAFGLVIEGTPRWAAISATDLGISFGVALGAAFAFPGAACPFAFVTGTI